MTRRDPRNQSNERSRPGRDAREIPGTGGGRRVVADPGGNRAARRKHQRTQEAGRGLPVDVLIVDDPVAQIDPREVDCARILGAKFDGVHDDSGALSLLKEMRFDITTEGRTVTCRVTHTPSGFTGTATGEGETRTRAAALRQVAEQLVAHWFGPRPLDVKAFGAVGDGITDDTDAIQRAINAAGDRNEATA